MTLSDFSTFNHAEHPLSDKDKVSVITV
jgi:hypothetical protein